MIRILLNNISEEEATELENFLRVEDCDYDFDGEDTLMVYQEDLLLVSEYLEDNCIDYQVI